MFSEIEGQTDSEENQTLLVTSHDGEQANITMQELVEHVFGW